MIARIILPIMIGTILPYYWIARHCCRLRSFWRVCFWIPAGLVIGYSVFLALQRNFIPENPLLEDLWFVVMALFAVPQFVFALCSVIGYAIMKYSKGTRNYGNAIGVLMAVVAFFSFLYGFTIGFRKLEIKEITLEVADLPKAFDGYRIVQFSDIHLGSYYGWRNDLPKRNVDSINALCPDMICFTGDLQNVQPSEISPYLKLLGGLKARDGIYSVLGNHDYSYYVDASPEEADSLERQVRNDEIDMGWHLLDNAHVVVRRGGDSIFVVGTGNYEKPSHSEVSKALYGIRKGNFILMLQHIPTQWKKMWPSNINKEYGSKDTVLVAPQLTLSGHTHGGQISVLGLRPSMFAPFDYGLYEREGCLLYTTRGLGGTIPIRLGATAEIVVFTLKHKQ